MRLYCWTLVVGPQFFFYSDINVYVDETAEPFSLWTETNYNSDLSMRQFSSSM